MSVRSGRIELSFCWRTPRREIYNLGMVSGPALLKIKGTIGFSYFWDQTNENKLKKDDEIGQRLVSGALDDTKTIGKTGADIFAKSGPEKP